MSSSGMSYRSILWMHKIIQLIPNTDYVAVLVHEDGTGGNILESSDFDFIAVITVEEVTLKRPVNAPANALWEEDGKDYYDATSPMFLEDGRLECAIELSNYCGMAKRGSKLIDATAYHNWKLYPLTNPKTGGTKDE
jgi:hypothetical protein